MVCMYTLVGNCVDLSVTCSVYAVVGCAYAHCLVYVIGVVSSGQSILYYRFVSPIVFQFVHAHTAGMVLTLVHQKDPLPAAVLAAVLLTQAHYAMCTETGNAVRVTAFSPCAARWCMRVACVITATWVVASVREACGESWESPQNVITVPVSIASMGELVLAVRFPIALFFLPDIIFGVAWQAGQWAAWAAWE